MIQIRSGTLAERYEHGVRLRRKTLREKHAISTGQLIGMQLQSLERLIVRECPNWYPFATSGC
jgi:hypothetical protein